MIRCSPYCSVLRNLLLSTVCTALLIGKEPESFFSAPVSTSAGIVFSDDQSNGLFLLTSHGVQTISRMPGSGMYYSVSPDGRYLGYKEIRSDGKQSPIVYDLEKNSAVAVQKPSAQTGQISFSDHGTIAYTTGNQLHTLFNGSETTYDLGTYANIAPISPNGTFVVYNDNADQLWVMNLSSHKKQRITDTHGGYALPIWSPDGSQIVYSRLSGSLFIYSLVTNSTVLIGEGESPAWIDNTQLIYVVKQIVREKVVSSELFSIQSDGTDRRQMTATDDKWEGDLTYDRQSQSIIYSDVKRGGLYSRSFSKTAHSDREQQLLSNDRSFLSQSRMQKKTIPESPTTTAAAYFAMPYVHQVWDTPDWYNGHSACGATSSIMVIAYYNIVPVWNVWCSASGSSPAHNSPYGNYVCEMYTFREMPYSQTANDPNGKPSYGGYGFMWAGNYSPYSRTVDYYSNHGMTAQRFDSGASFFSTVIANVDSGYPFTLCNGLTTAGHIIVVNGYDANNRTLIVNDPYGNKNSGTYPSLNGKGVKYDWVGYNNGYRNLNRIYWGVSVRYQMMAQADTLVDDAHLNKGFYLHTAAPSSLSRWFDKKTGGYLNGHFWWTRTKSSDTCYATWTAELAKDGWYDVSAYIPYSDAINAQYRVTALDSIYSVRVNQKLIKNNWVSLGMFPFATGTSASVRLGDGSDTTKQGIVFDAVRWTFIQNLPTTISQQTTGPKLFSLEQNFPNPFNPTTTITFTMPVQSEASVTIHNVLGREVARLAEGVADAGVHRYQFSADEYGLSSGVYFYSLRAGTNLQTKRMIILK